MEELHSATTAPDEVSGLKSKLKAAEEKAKRVWRLNCTKLLASKDDRIATLDKKAEDRTPKEAIEFLLSEEERATFDAAVQALRERLYPGGKVMAAQDFRHCSQSEDEPVSDFIRRLERTFRLAYGHDKMSTETRHALLHGEGLRQRVMEAPAVSGATTYTMLCHAAKNEERRQAELKKRKQYQTDHIPGDHPLAHLLGLMSCEVLPLLRPPKIRCSISSHQILMMPEFSRYVSVIRAINRTVCE